MLKNVLGLRNPDELAEYEAMSFALRAFSPLPAGRFSLGHYRAVHRYLFQDVYRWAGRFRTIRIGKGGSLFCLPEHVPEQMHRLFRRLRQADSLRGLDAPTFATGAAAFLAELNAIHPFREGNGRAQTTFLAALATRAGHPLNLAGLNEARYLEAMILSFHGDEAPLRDELLMLTG